MMELMLELQLLARRLRLEQSWQELLLQTLVVPHQQHHQKVMSLQLADQMLSVFGEIRELVLQM
jgi:hypothetical protein